MNLAQTIFLMACLSLLTAAIVSILPFVSNTFVLEEADAKEGQARGCKPIIAYEASNANCKRVNN